MTTHKHFWVIVGRWAQKHALVHCRHCPAWTVAEYGVLPYGPCPHAINQAGESVPVPKPLPTSPAELFAAYKTACMASSLPTCIHCQAPRSEEGACKNCGR